MTDKLYEVLSRRYANRDKRVPWVFWHRYRSRKVGDWTVGPYKERKKIMRTRCDRAGVRYFRYHALRHFGASLLEQSNVPNGSIQRILGHENRSTTELYLHSIGESERQAMDVFNDLHLHMGEAEALCLCIENNAKLCLLDDKDARIIARLNKIPISGTLGVLLKAKKMGIIDSIKKFMDRLRTDHHYWIDDAMYNKVLNLTGE
jgi:predicted nucleic acid-binding protein